MSVTTYTYGHDANTLKSHQSRTAAKQADYLIPHIQPNHDILDVGCGPGTITCDFAKLASKGKVTGVDYSEEVMAEAQREADKRGLTNVTFKTASALSLPFEDNTFDIVHCHAVLTHLPNAADAIKEMRRVCKPGGYVAAREPDWDTGVIYPHSEDIELWKQLDKTLKQREGSEPNAGRHLAEWAVTAGFRPDQLKVTCDVLEYTGKDEARWWGESYAERMKAGFGKRAVESALATQEQVDRMFTAYIEWSKSEVALWAMMFMKLLAQK